MSRQHSVRAGAVFKAILASDPATKAAWEATREVEHSPEFRKAFRDLIAELSANKKAVEERLKAAGLPAPQTIEDWEHLARVAELPIEILRSGTLTVREIYDYVEAWLTREEWRLTRARSDAALTAPQAPGASEAGGAAQPQFVFCRDGDGWFVRGFGRQGHFKDMVGFRHLAKLLATPTGAVAMMELMAGVESGGRLPVGDDVLDRQAWKSYLQRRNEIDAEIAKARRHNDQGALDSLEREKQWILDELKSAKGLGGKGRKLGDDLNRQRTRIANALGRAYSVLKNGGLEKLANHFRLTISAEGNTYTYRPDERPAWMLSGPVTN